MLSSTYSVAKTSLGSSGPVHWEEVVDCMSCVVLMDLCLASYNPRCFDVNMHHNLKDVSVTTVNIFNCLQ